MPSRLSGFPRQCDKPLTAWPSAVRPLSSESPLWKPKSPIMPLIFEEKVVKGSVYGSSRPRIDIPKLINLYRAGKLKLDELVTRTYSFDQINEAYAALERGEVARTVVLM